MSTAVVVPPPNSSSLLRHVPRLTARARSLLTVVNLHYAGVAVLSVVVLYLVAHLIFVTQELSSNNAEAFAQQRTQLTAAQVAAKPLRGLDAKLTDSTAEANRFYEKRLPYAYSQVAAELGSLTKREGVRLSRVQYSQNPILAGSGDAALTEVNMDASISGDYRPIVQFINAAERDKMFFVVRGINFTGQQTGLVNLRLRMTTYLRMPQAGELADAPPPSDQEDEAATQPGVAR